MFSILSRPPRSFAKPLLICGGQYIVDPALGRLEGGLQPGTLGSLHGSVTRCVTLGKSRPF